MFYNLFIFFLYLSIFVSCISQDTVFLSILLSFLSVSSGMLFVIRSKKTLIIPKHFLIFTIFALILHLYIPFVQDKIQPFYYSAVISEALFYWLIFYNIEGGKLIAKRIFITFSILYSSILLITKTFDLNFFALAESIFQEAPNKHYYYNCFWVPAIILLFEKELKKIKKDRLILIIAGIVFLIISDSRTSFVAFVLSIVYMIYKRYFVIELKRKYIMIPVLLMGVLFVYLGVQKTTLFSRPYFAQSIQSFPQNPLGVGFGNFAQISDTFRGNENDWTPFSGNVHNIILESLSGVGVFTILLVAFLFLIIKDVLLSKSEGIVWGAVVIFILTSFMFDSSYAIPCFIWLLFISLGIFQSKALTSS